MKGQGRYWCSFLVMACVVILCAAQPGMALVVSEVMYHPVEDDGTPDGNETFEFVELYNNRVVIEDLGGYAFTNGISYTFAPGTTLGGREYLVVAKNPAALEAEYGISGVYGPFTGKLNNDGERIEMSNENEEIIISFRYNDARPWPSSPDGTGHSLILSKLGGDPEEAPTWAPSTYIGGSPGGPDETQVEPEDPTLVTLVDLGHPGRYFKGTKEPSPDGGGVPTTDWTERTFDDDPSTTDWLDGPSGYGYSTEQSERDWIRTTLDDMEDGYYSVYARLRFTLTAEQKTSFSGLRAEVHYDDGFALYLNGTRVAAPTNLSGNPPAFDTEANGASDYDEPANFDLTSLMGQLVVGTNVLAIQMHNKGISSSDVVSCPILKAVVEAPGSSDDTRARIVINELLANSDSAPGTDWLELYNPGPSAVDLNNVYISDGRFELLKYKIPDGTVLQPGDFWAVREAPDQNEAEPDELPFALSYAGETIFLTAATNDPVLKPLRVLDTVRYGVVEPDITIGRFPDGSDYFGPLVSPTFENNNAQPLIRDIVINEIMYHHGIRDERYEYVELYNKGAGTVSLEGWAFTDGISYDFNEVSQVTEMAPGSYLVVAKDPDLLETVYGNLAQSGPGANLVGPYSGEMDDHTERIRLSYPFEDPETHDVNMVTVDEVTYYDGGRWPMWADGQGASLELRDPRSNNNTPDGWADSDESSKATWEQYSHTISSSDSRYTHDAVNVFGLMLLNRGEVLLDDLELIVGSNKLTNGGFESGETDWRILGNHVQSFVTTADSKNGSRSLHLIATGHGDPGNNRINQSISATATTVTFRFWAKRLRGCQYLLMRASNDLSPRQPPRPAYSFELDMPLDQGTPGRQNTAFVSNRGPDILNVQHAPVLPASGEPIVVTAIVADNDGVGTVTLCYRSEGSGSFSSMPMLDDGSGNDLVEGDGIYTAAIPGASSGTMRAFYIEASDGSASNRFPTMLGPTADVPNRTCLVRVGDTMEATQFAIYRVWMSNDVISTFTSRANLSNELLDCTFVYNDTEVFYNTRIRFRGSPFIRGGEDWNPCDRHPWRIDFNSDQKYRDREEINLDRTETTSRGPLQERASYWFYRKMGLQYSMQEFIVPIMNGNSHHKYEDVQKIDGDYIDGWFPDDDEGYIHKIDDYFEYNVEGTNKSNLDEGLKYDSSHPLLKETHRWSFEKRSHREADDWDHLFDFAVAMNTSSSNGAAYEAAIESFIHPEQFARMLALRHAVGDWDSYGHRRSKNNYFYYALPEGKWYLLPWDIDFTLGSGDPYDKPLFPTQSGKFPEVYRFLNYSKYRRMYLQAFAELVHGPWQTSYGTADPPTDFDKFLDDAANALIADGQGSCRRDGIKAYVRDRRAYILTQLPGSEVFEITTNSGQNFCTSDSTVTIMGVAPLEVSGISVNGTPVPADFTSENVFTVNVDIEAGSNLLILQGLNGVGDPVSGATDSITVSRALPCAVTSVTPSTVCSNGTTQLTIYGSGFEPGSPATVALASVSEELGFEALYVQSNQSFDRIEAATLQLNYPDSGVGDPTYAAHPWINLYNSGSSHGEFAANETPFAAPFDAGGDNFAVRFTGDIYAPSPGVRYFSVNSDEGFKLSIDGQLVGEYAYVRTPATSNHLKNRTMGTMTFDFPAAGRYHLVLDYFENDSGEEIEFFQTDFYTTTINLINVDAELVVYRDNVTTIDATNVVVVDENTITCQVNLTGAERSMYKVIVTSSDCGGASACELDEALAVCRSNFNSDSQIDFLDWVQLAGKWNKPCSEPDWCNGIDLDHSKFVDFGDVLFFSQDWLLP